jgi:hypothetical protein
MTYRIAQQVRLWIYGLLLIAVFFISRGTDMALIAFLSFAALLLLPYLEICPTCGRLAWWETKKWPNAFWIGSRCNRLPRSDCESGDCHESTIQKD